MKKKFLAVLAVGLITLAAGGMAQATPFTVYGSESPSNYMLTGPGGTQSNLVTAVFKADPWVSGNWMAPTENQSWPMLPVEGSGNPPGVYHYITTFNLNGFNLATASLTGTWASDNNGLLFLNGINFSNTTSGGFSSLTSFNITQGFISGTNTLDFKVTNDSYDPSNINPTGLLVNITGNAAPVPEPGTMVLLGAGMLGLAIFGKRRMNKEV